MKQPPVDDDSRESLRRRSEFRDTLVEALREQMKAALDADYFDEANILLDALVLLNRGVGGDLEAPITVDERVSIQV